MLTPHIMTGIAIKDRPATRRADGLSVAIALMLAALVALIVPEGNFEQALHKFKDAINTRAASGQIHLVEIDAASIAAINRWPWPRSTHARVIDRLDRAGVSQIAFDVDFSARSIAREDAALAAALARADGKVILPTFRQSSSATDTGTSFENLPIASLREHAFLGSVNVRPEASGHVNRYPFGTVTQGIPRPSLGALLGGANGHVSDDFRIDQSIDIGTIPRHSFVDILEGRFDAAALRGKTVIIGATAIEIGDRYATNRFGVIPGVVVQALAAETLIAGPVIAELGGWPMIGLALLAVIATLRLGAGNIAAKAGYAVATAAGIFAISLLAERFRVAHLDVMPALVLVAGFIAGQYAVGMMHKISSARRIDTETLLPNQIAWQDDDASDTTVTVIVADIGNFGEIAATLDKAEASRFLRAVADRLELASGPGGLYRIGREQFCWKAGASESEDVDASVEAAARLFTAPLLVSGRSIRATMGFGVARGNHGQLSELASQGTLAAKRALALGVRVIWHDDALAFDTDQSLFILSEFETALANRQISLAYQPKYALAADAVVGAEALVRWYHPAKGAISPAIFIPILEQESLVGSLTLFVLRQAIADMAQWQQPGRRIGCAINISGSVLLDPGFVDDALAIVRASRIDPAMLTFEITETAVISSLERAASTLTRFRDIGIRLSIDDYGTGQSTLSYLKGFAADEIKIDQSFIKTIASESTNRIMVRSTIELAHELGTRVVAEGVEDADAMAVLRDLGCDIVQGWHIGKAIAHGDFLTCWCTTESDATIDAVLPRQIAS